MPEPYELFICYDGDIGDSYLDMIESCTDRATILPNGRGWSRFKLINIAVEAAKGEFIMHVENDFYWVDPSCLDAALNAFHRYPRLDYIRFEHLPFTQQNFYSYNQVDGKDICWMKKDSPYQFTFNPHIRKFKYPNDEPFMTEGFTKQPEQHHNDGYKYISACMTGDNWRHLGIYDEGGHYKDYYADRFTGLRNTKDFDPWTEFTKITNNPTYLDLFMGYLNDNRNQHSS